MDIYEGPMRELSHKEGWELAKNVHGIGRGMGLHDSSDFLRIATAIWVQS